MVAIWVFTHFPGPIANPIERLGEVGLHLFVGLHFFAARFFFLLVVLRISELLVNFRQELASGPEQPVYVHGFFLLDPGRDDSSDLRGTK